MNDKASEKAKEPICASCGDVLGWSKVDMYCVGDHVFTERLLECSGCGQAYFSALFPWEDNPHMRLSFLDVDKLREGFSKIHERKA